MSKGNTVRETDGNSEHFDQIPDALMEDTLTVRCKIPELEPDLCDGWVESFDIGNSRVKMDGYGRLYFPDNVTTECPKCGDRVLEINGVEVNFHA
ncbi:hypothetical protein C475_19488 [Halosimplex carlsbadense 2-9-1]|uniref:Uncharacterized protein n=1 Tax=Halosimplex carlsbadense 2-9-1 TaxID=797114 RepID=M0CC51_9EURY|nr:hypothetical protein [Halosimplex carlsbadense]ELZ20815.1 hypothetical protein C475_19488 [Halosimplex carlsbadense 2-9-1]